MHGKSRGSADWRSAGAFHHCHRIRHSVPPVPGSTSVRLNEPRGATDAVRYRGGRRANLASGRRGPVVGILLLDLPHFEGCLIVVAVGHY